MAMLALIAGATASGKSALALQLAERTDGVIVNADSAQIYRDLPILSAAPTKNDLERAEHRLYGIADGAHPCSAADWAKLAKREISDVHAQARLPILVGGTGLYIRTLLFGIAPIPPIDADVRREIRAAPVDENRVKLLKLDPQAAARLNSGDSARIARALEVVTSSGRTLAEWQKHREGGIAHTVSLRPLVLLPPRDWLYARCDKRFARMVEQGAIDEVKALLARKLGAKLPIMRAIGVHEIADFLAGKLSLDEAIAKGRQATRQYAKRQYTWFAHQPPTGWRSFREILDNTTMPAALELFGVSA